VVEPVGGHLVTLAPTALMRRRAGTRSEQPEGGLYASRVKGLAEALLRKAAAVGSNAQDDAYTCVDTIGITTPPADSWSILLICLILT